MITDVPLLRFMLLSSLIGFMAFCASYAILVWRKRRSSSAAAATARTRLRRWSITGVVLGCLGFLVTLVVREAVRADGMLGGDDLYVVRSTGDLKPVHVAEDGAAINEGDLLARFTSSEVEADIQKAEDARNRAKAELDRVSTDPLVHDPELVREHNLAHSERQNLLNMMKNARTAYDMSERDNLNHVTTLRDKVASKKAELKTGEGDLKATQKKLEFAKQQLTRELELNKRSNNVSLSELNDRQKEVGALEADVIKYDSRIAADKETLKGLESDLALFEKTMEGQTASHKEAISDIHTRLVKLDEEKKQFDYRWNLDTALAEKRREDAKANQELALKHAENALASRQNRLEVKAPFEGHVVYRHSSPAAVAINGALVVVARDGGVRLKFRLPQEQTEAIRNAGTIPIELDETANTVEQRFPGKFLRATTLDREPGMSLVEFACEVPPEVAAALADGKPVKARFSWRPPLMNLWPFPVSAVLFGLGVFGLLIVNLTGWRLRPAKPEEQEEDGDDVMVTLARVPAPKEGDTAEAAFDTIPVRPELPNMPREKPVQPWEHPVGVRLRDAIVREDVTAELMDAVEGAIEFQKDAVIVPMREALRRVPSVPDHARKLVQKLNEFETTDELKLIEKRCLAQRVTFLLYTLGIDIHSKPERPIVTAR